MRGMEEVVWVSGLAWTIMRPPWLTNRHLTSSYQTEVQVDAGHLEAARHVR